MDKQFLMDVIVQKQIESIENENDNCCTLYIMNAILVHFRPCWFSNKKIGDAFTDLEEQLDQYFKKFGKREEYVSSFRGDGPTFHPWQNIIDPAHLGLIMSTTAKEVRYCKNAFQQYVRRVFPNAKKNHTKFFDMVNKELKAVAPQPKLGKKLDISGQKNVPIRPSETASGKEFTELYMEMMSYIFMLMIGTPNFSFDREMTAAWATIPSGGSTVTVDPSSMPARQASCLNPSFMAVAACQPQFQELMSTIFYVRSSDLEVEPMTRLVDRRKDRYFEAARETVLPAVRAFNEARTENMKLTDATARLSKALMSEKDKHAKDIASMERAIEEERRETKRASAYNKEVAVMKEEIAKARKKVDSTVIDLERTKADLAKAQEENKRLSATVSEGQAAFNEINAQLISIIEEQNQFLDDEDLMEQDAPPAPTGVREHIGEDAYQKLSGKKLVIVGGHANTQRVLRELFPEWRFYAVNEWLPDTLSSVDAVVILSKYISHKSYEQAKSVIKGTGIPMLLVNFNGPSSICRSLAEQIF